MLRRRRPSARSVSDHPDKQPQGERGSASTSGPGDRNATLQGHENASCSNCGANCGPGSDKRIGKCCGCNLYNWTQPELHAFLLAAEGAHIREVFVARPLGVPPGTTSGTPKWFVDELAGFLQRDPLVQATHSQATHSLSTQY